MRTVNTSRDLAREASALGRDIRNIHWEYHHLRSKSR